MDWIGLYSTSIPILIWEHFAAGADSDASPCDNVMPQCLALLLLCVLLCESNRQMKYTNVTNVTNETNLMKK